MSKSYFDRKWRRDWYRDRGKEKVKAIAVLCIIGAIVAGASYFAMEAIK